MKKAVTILACIFFLPWQESFCKGSQQKIDSLLAQLKILPQDTNRLRILGELCSNLQAAGNFKSQLEYAAQMRALAEKLLPGTKGKEQFYIKKMLGNSYLSAARANRSLGNLDEALKNAFESKKIFETMDSLSYLASALQQIGTIYVNKGDLAEGGKYDEEAIKIYKKLGKKKELGRLYVNHGANYLKLGNYAEALKNEFAALKILEGLKDSVWIETAQINIAQIYRAEKNFPEAVKQYESALKIASLTDDKEGMAYIYAGMGTLYADMQKPDDALKNMNAALKLNEEMNNKYEVARVLSNMAAVYNRQGKKQESLKTLLKAQKPAEETGGKELIGYINYGIATNYSELKNYDKAIEYFKKAIEIGKEMKSNSWLREYYNGISWAYREKKDYKNAYEYHDLYSQMNDSVYNETRSQQFAELKTEYESEKKDAEITLLNKDTQLKDAEIKKQKMLKYSFVGGLAAILILSFVLFNNFRVRSQLRLQTLRNKIASDLHDDVGSTLSSIAIFSEVAQQQSKEVIPMLNTIGESARKMLDAMADIVWTINPENDNFEKIILRMRSFAYQLLGAKKIEFEFDADQEAVRKKLSMDVRKNLYLIFKEATNNMVKYSEANKASFFIKGEKNELTLLIRDNGKGFDLNKESLGNGLRNMKKRAEEIRAKLLIESIPGNGTTIQLLLRTV